MSIVYGKYNKSGAIHWKWYSDETHNYHRLVDDSLIPLDNLNEGNVLDIGSGDGLVSSLLIKKGFNVIGVEPNPIGNEIALEKLDKEKFSLYPISVEDFVDKNIYKDIEIDYLYSLNTIEHVDNAESFIDIMRNVKHFGIIITDDADRITGRKNSSFHTKEFTIKELKDLFKEFNVEEIYLHHSSFIGIKIWKK